MSGAEIIDAEIVAEAWNRTDAAVAERVVSTTPFRSSAAAGWSVPGTELDSGTPLELPGTPLKLVEWILKDRLRLEGLIREPAEQAGLLPRFLAVCVGGFALYGVAMATLLQASGVWPQLASMAGLLEGEARAMIRFEPVAGFGEIWASGSALHLIIAYTAGLIAATGICLPSLYFYGLLAGVRMSMLDVVVHSLKAKATAAVALVGLLPIYAALAMGMIVLGVGGALRDGVLLVGLTLPFIGGLWGTYSLYQGFLGLADTMPPSLRCRRVCFLRRLVLAWAGCYTAVTPIMIYTLWEFLARA
ncbi:MAG: hypothetical protein AB7F89_01055 [Pirellulaceae bacterium]